jgi:hypothetical protein
VGRHPAPLQQQPGWARSSSPAWASRPVPPRGPTPRSAFPGWAGVPATSGPSRRPGLSPCPAGPLATDPAGPAPRPPAGLLPQRPRLGSLLQRTGLPRLGFSQCSTRLGRIRRIRPGRDFPSRLPLLITGWAGLWYSGWARLILPWPRPDYLHNRPRYSSPGPRFIPTGVFYSFGINSIVLCQSWDASRLGLAHPPSLYAGLGTPLGSDQHIPPLLVSLILRRRIRLMTW